MGSGGTPGRSWSGKRPGPGVRAAPSHPSKSPREDSPDHRAPHLVSATPAAHLARPRTGPSPTGPAQCQSAQPGVPRVGGTRVGGSSSRREGAKGHWPSAAASPHIYPHLRCAWWEGKQEIWAELENTARVSKRPTCSPRPDLGEGTGLSVCCLCPWGVGLSLSLPF